MKVAPIIRFPHSRKEDADVEKDAAASTSAAQAAAAIKSRRRRFGVGLVAGLLIFASIAALYVVWKQSAIMVDFIEIRQRAANGTSTVTLLPDMEASIAVWNTLGSKLETRAFDVEVQSEGRALVRVTVPAGSVLAPLKSTRFVLPIASDNLALLEKLCGSGMVVKRLPVTITGAAKVSGWRALLPGLPVSSRLSDIPCMSLPPLAARS
ncbi:hypothetical protein H9P43_003882 [Blastocladiella emersonii ATCC 22665]|nr:hypothetical protein H9P43_003882 [Blastocladiella emersonii ATCC 22665]